MHKEIWYYSKLETAQMVGKSTQTIILWEKAGDKLEAEGKPRLIPQAFRFFKDNKCGGNRYWTAQDIEKIKIYADSVRRGKQV